MYFLNNHHKLKKTLMLLLLLAAAPFALELLIFIEFGGIEVAFICLLTMLKPFRLWLTFKFKEIRAVTEQLKLSVQRHSLSQPSVYFSHVAATGMMFIVSSSVLVSACLWIPLLAINGPLI
ncbi:hypothetical protein [Neptunicella sp.]|uniref:hypothetical protein n=1 Tax=Neptunicella sp. TaxID=2125986 RepID=UPI003F691308